MNSKNSSRISARVAAVPPGFLTVAAAVALLAVLQVLPPAWHGVLRYERGAVLDGELWRLFTGHLIHLGLVHGALNAAGLVLCALLADRVDAPMLPGWLLLRLVALGGGVSLLLLAWAPEVSHYVGLSGVLYGLFVLVLWPQARRKEPIGMAALCMLVGWMLWQTLYGPAPSEMELMGGRIVVQAHLFGVLSAMAILLAQALLHASRSRRSPNT
jgi:rhomboid family GlyGly-CTERM serine protease